MLFKVLFDSKKFLLLAHLLGVNTVLGALHLSSQNLTASLDNWGGCLHFTSGLRISLRKGLV